MKRDMAFIRDLLLVIEAAPGREIHLDQLIAAGELENVDRTKLDVHLELLYNAHFMQAAHKPLPGGNSIWLNMRLTWSGHEFLESVRDPEVWQKTKDGASKVGNWGVEFIVDLAKAYGKHEVRKRLGIEL